MNNPYMMRRLSPYNAATLASLVIVALAAAVVWKECQTALANAQASVLNTARILADHVDQEFHVVNAWLQIVAQRHQQTHALGPEEIRRFHEQLQREERLYPLTSCLAISDEQGRIIFHTGNELPLDLGDREFFQLARAGEDKLIFSPPRQSYITGEWALILARRFDDGVGRFEGIVLAVLPVAAIGKSLGEVDLGPLGVIDLRAANLGQILRLPALGGSDQAPPNANLAQIMQDLLAQFPQSHAFFTPASSDGSEIVYAYQRLQDHPFYMTVGRATADFATGWKETALLLASLSLMVVVILFGGVRRMEQQNQCLERRVTERTRDLAEREHFLHSLSDALPSLIGYWDAGLRNRFANRAHLEWFGKTAEEMSGLHLRDLLGADRFALNEPRIRAALGGEPLSFKGRLTRSDGSVRRTWSHFIPDLRGDEVQGFFVLITDITEITRAEAENALLRRILDESPDFIGLSDLVGNPCYLNAAAKGLIGLAPDADLSQIHLSDLYPVWASRRIARTGIPKAIEQDVWIGESTVQRHDGRKIPVSQTILVHRNGRGRPEWLSTIIRDISDQKRQAAALAAARRAALAASKAKSAFLANMSHEIRTPLNAVLGMAYLLEQSPLGPEQRDKLGKIQTAGRVLLELVNDVLDLSKIEAGEIELEHIAFNPAALFGELQALVAQQADKKGLTLDFAPLPEAMPAALVGDPHRLRQILLNLLNNAVKFTEQGGVYLGVRLIETPWDVRVRLRFEVTDTGIGIPADALPSLFTPFTQADGSTTRRFGGTGLGLSIVRHFAELMGGEVGVESEEGRGSTFWVELPFAVAPDPAMNSTPNPETLVRVMTTIPSPATTAPAMIAAAAPTEREQLHGVRVLLVDDSATNLDVAGGILAHEGALVSTCINGAAALDWLRTSGNQADIVLMDVQMPVMDGNTAVREIRRDPALAALPVVALTAGALLSERDKSFAAGMDDYLTKPFEPRQMVRVVRHQLGRARGAPLPLGPSRDARPGLVDTWPPITGIDVDDVRARLDGNLELFIRVLRRFLAEFGDWRAAPRLRSDAGVLDAKAAQTTEASPEPGEGPQAAAIPATGETQGAGGAQASGEAREALARYLHKLAGSAGMLGAKVIHRLAKDAERRLQASPPVLEGIETLFAELADHLAVLAASAAPHLEAAARERVEYEAAAATEVTQVLDVAALVELKAQLAGRRMAALSHYMQLVPTLRRMLPPEDFSRLEAAMDGLDFKTALAVLERSP